MSLQGEGAAQPLHERLFRSCLMKSLQYGNISAYNMWGQTTDVAPIKITLVQIHLVKTTFPFTHLFLPTFFHPHGGWKMQIKPWPKSCVKSTQVQIIHIGGWICQFHPLWVNSELNGIFQKLRKCFRWGVRTPRTGLLGNHKRKKETEPVQTLSERSSRFPSSWAGRALTSFVRNQRARERNRETAAG